MQPLGVGGVDVRDFEVKNCYESSGRDWSARSAPIGGEGVCLKWVIERYTKETKLYEHLLNNTLHLFLSTNQLQLTLAASSGR
ncbi:hypothetical protein TNCV_1991971 [Trichonephila clavipes]|nr:hypothetical protein TNCV_1991971 [Trichonephila clavipes]